MKGCPARKFLSHKVALKVVNVLKEEGLGEGFAGFFVVFLVGVGVPEHFPVVVDIGRSLRVFL